jgi:hypothetical protein
VAGAARWEERQRVLAQRLGTRLEAAEGSGHPMMSDHPDAVARAVLNDRGPKEARAAAGDVGEAPPLA